MSVTPPGTDTSYAWENTSGGTFSWEWECAIPLLLT